MKRRILDIYLRAKPSTPEPGDPEQCGDPGRIGEFLLHAGILIQAPGGHGKRRPRARYRPDHG